MWDRESEVDTMVSSILSRSKTPTQKRLQGFKIAKLYLDFGDYSKANKYLTDYLSERNNEPLAHELMGEIYEALGQQAEALESFKRAYQHGGSRFYKLVIKISELHCEIGADVQTLKIWLEQCNRFFPKSSTAVKLEAHINSTNSRQIPSTNVQALGHDELFLHIKLLNDRADIGSLEMAYEAAVSCNFDIKFVEDYDWFDCLKSIFQKFGAKNPTMRSTCDYNLHFLYILRNLTYLSLCTRDTDTCVNALNCFDQQLNHALSLDITDGTWHGLMKEIKGQFFYLAGVLVLKKAQDGSLQLETDVMAAGACFLTSYRVDPFESNEHWFTNIPKQRTTFCRWWYLQSNDRASQIVHMLNEWSSCNVMEWSKSITNKFRTPDQRNSLYRLLFGNRAWQEGIEGSFFYHSKEMFERSYPIKQLTDRQLTEIDKVACKHHMRNLSHLVWLCRQHYSTDMDVQPHYAFFTVEDFQKANDHRAKDFLSATDVLVFLLATVRCSSHAVSDSSLIDSPWHSFPMPACLIKELCTPEQAEWWTAAYNYCTSKYKSEFSDVSRILVKGIQTVRLVGQHGMSVHMMVHIARSLDAKLKALKGDGNECQFPKGEIIAIEMRAENYWKEIENYMKKLQRNEKLQASSNRLFEEPHDMELLQEQIESYLSESTFALALALMNRSDYPRAVESFKQIGSAKASLYCAKAYKQWAKKEMSEDNDTEKKHLWIEELLSHARDLLYNLIESKKGDKNLMDDVVKELDEVELIVHKEKLSEVQDSLSDSGFIHTPSKSEPDYESRSGARRNIFNSTPIQPDSKAGSRYRSQVVQVNRSPTSPANVLSQIRSLRLSQQQLERSVVIWNNEQKQNQEALVKIIENNDQIIAINNQIMEEVRGNTIAIKKSVEQNSELIKDLQNIVGESKNVMIEIQKELGNLKQHSAAVEPPMMDIPVMGQHPQSVTITRQLVTHAGQYQHTVTPTGQREEASALKEPHPQPGLFTKQHQQPPNVTGNGQHQQSTSLTGNGQPKQSTTLTGNGQHQKPTTLTGNGQCQQYGVSDLSLSSINKPAQDVHCPEPDTDPSLEAREEISPKMLETALETVRQLMNLIEERQQKQIEWEKVLQEQMIEIMSIQREIQESLKRQTEFKKLGTCQQSTTRTGHGEYQQSGTFTEQHQESGTLIGQRQQPDTLKGQCQQPGILTEQHQSSTTFTGIGQNQQHGATDLSLSSINKPKPHVHCPEPDTDPSLVAREEISLTMLENALDTVRQQMNLIEEEQQKQREMKNVLQEGLTELIIIQREIQEALQTQTGLKKLETYQQSTTLTGHGQHQQFGTDTFTAQHQESGTLIGQHQQPGMLTEQHQHSTTYTGSEQHHHSTTFNAYGQHQQPGTVTGQHQHPGILTEQHQESKPLTRHEQHQRHGVTDLFLASINKPPQDIPCPEPDTDPSLVAKEEISLTMLETILDTVRQQMNLNEKEQQRQREMQNVLQEHMTELINVRREIQESLQNQRELKNLEQIQKQPIKHSEHGGISIEEREPNEQLEDTQKKLGENVCRGQMEQPRQTDDTHNLRLRNVKGKIYYCNRNSTLVVDSPSDSRDDLGNEQDLELDPLSQGNESANPGNTTDEMNTEEDSATDHPIIENQDMGLVRRKSHVQDHGAFDQTSDVAQCRATQCPRPSFGARSCLKRFFFLSLCLFCLVFFLSFFLWKMELIPIEIELNFK